MTPRKKDPVIEGMGVFYAILADEPLHEQLATIEWLRARVLADARKRTQEPA